MILTSKTPTEPGALLDTGLAFGGVEVRRLSPGEMDQAFALRARIFRNGQCDRDAFDAQAMHIGLFRAQNLVGYFRARIYAPETLAQSYAAQFYDLTGLTRMAAPSLEIGRVILDQPFTDPHPLRLALKYIGQIIAAAQIGLVMGCSSFAGLSSQDLRLRQGVLAGCNRGPKSLIPQQKAPEILCFDQSDFSPNRQDKLTALPPLLRAYLRLGGWISDHAVIDRDLGTLHVFTALEIAKIPPQKSRLLFATMPQTT
ncbi:MAG: GNAT family N-acyltransferase [Mangrovicoccus sp.]